MPTPPGACRPMTVGEIELCRPLFGDAIDYQRVKIYNKKYLPFGIQGDNTAMAPNGGIYWPTNHFCEDFALASWHRQHWFMHEMTHVWQYQRGFWLKLHGLFSWAVNYHYQLTPCNSVSHYGMEQQACLFADYWLLSRHGEEAWRRLTKAVETLSERQEPLTVYRQIMAAYFVDKTDVCNLPRGRKL
jgi:hypothetical protein